MSGRWVALAPVVFLATGACFATHSDVQVLQNDLMKMHADAMHADSVRGQQIANVVAAVGTARDSLRVLSARMAKLGGDVRGDLYAMGQQLIQVQELMGQSQQRLQEMRAALEERNRSAPPQPVQQPPVTGDTSAAAPASTLPGPNQLFQLSLDQLRRGSAGAALTGFQTLLRQYPTADVAPDAQFYIGEAYSAQGDTVSADKAYAAVVANFPQSPRAPTALYKRALLMQAGGNLTGARAALNQIVRDYPRSDEAALARERLKTIK
jgi:tol-pal system protein YbgF